MVGDLEMLKLQDQLPTGETVQYTPTASILKIPNPESTKSNKLTVYQTYTSNIFH